MRNFNIHEIWAFDIPHFKKDMEFVKQWLLSHGYGGLFRSDRNCCCKIDDLRPCIWMPNSSKMNGHEPESCEAGYLIECEHGFHIVRNKS